MVARTLIVQRNAVGIWPSSVSALCGFSGIDMFATGAHHCDRTTFVDQRIDARIITDDYNALVVLAHEAGHGVQEAHGVPVVATSLSADHRGIRNLELSADCYSGAAIRWLVDSHVINVVNAPAWTMTALYRHLPNDPGHGSGTERGAAFRSGYDGGRTACSAVIGSPVF